MKLNSILISKATLILVMLFACFISKAQTDNIQNNSQGDSTKIYKEEMPEFPGGETKLFKYIGKSMKYPKWEAENRISGTVYVSYEINEEGKVQNARVSKGVIGGTGLDNEALRIIQNMPAWKPGKVNGKPVTVKFTLPVKFKL